MENNKKENPASGHRQRLKNRYMESGFSSFSDHEVLELIFFYAIPRRDTKPMAKQLLADFGSLQAVFEASPEDLMRIGKVSENVAILFSLMLKTYEVYLAQEDTKIVFKSPDVVSRYLKKFFVNEKRECFYLVCLDQNKKLINTLMVSEGSTNEIQIYIRNIFEVVIKTNATNVILVHNHPSGECVPSKSDIMTTNEIIKSLELVSVKVVDHIIMTKDDYYSFAKNKIIKNSI